MNDRQRFLIPGFLLGRGEIRKVLPLLLSWAKLELTEGWKSWGRQASEPVNQELTAP